MWISGHKDSLTAPAEIEIKLAGDKDDHLVLKLLKANKDTRILLAGRERGEIETLTHETDFQNFNLDTKILLKRLPNLDLLDLAPPTDSSTYYASGMGINIAFLQPLATLAKARSAERAAADQSIPCLTSWDQKKLILAADAQPRLATEQTSPHQYSSAVPQSRPEYMSSKITTNPTHYIFTLSFVTKTNPIKLTPSQLDLECPLRTSTFRWKQRRGKSKGHRQKALRRRHLYTGSS